MLNRPPRILGAIAVLWFVVVVAVFSDAGVSFSLWTVVTLWGVALAVCWAIWLAATWWHGRSERTRLIREHWRWWLLSSGAVVGGFVLAATSPLLSVRVYLSAAALRESPAILLGIPEKELFENGRWVGLFRVQEFSQFGSELRFITNQCGLLNTCGVVYSPDGPPEHRGEDSFSHLYGPWWHLYQSW